jgi:hypothetical protein
MKKPSSRISAVVLSVLILGVAPTPARARYSIQAEIEIDAAPEKTWAVLSDLPSWPDWNPFIRYAHGTLAKGSLIDVEVDAPGAKPIKGKGKVFVLDAPHEMVWVATLVGSWIFRGEHHFTVEPLPGGKSRFIQTEHFSGLLSPLVHGKVKRETQPGFEAMNAALKKRVEGQKTP